MLGTHKATGVASALFEIGALSGSAQQLHDGNPYGALTVAFIACVCVVMITGTLVAVAVVNVRLRAYLRSHDERKKPPPGPEKPDA
jgi:hypothetical protein